ncbi:uncharacterized protein BDW70DRAFT_165355 [Aspergillus foveolatus]|uniref:uncharacterized protein n=1 Tax=Aspergillus foveolatus TaxID=210207 RepID=UPI003CCE1D07
MAGYQTQRPTPSTALAQFEPYEKAGLSASILLNHSTEMVAFVPFLLYGTATVSSGRSK